MNYFSAEDKLVSSQSELLQQANAIMINATNCTHDKRLSTNTTRVMHLLGHTRTDIQDCRHAAGCETGP
jgi:hypothetical protein